MFKPIALACGHSLCEVQVFLRLLAPLSQLPDVQNCIRFTFGVDSVGTEVYFCYQCYTRSQLSRAKTPCIILSSCLENCFPNESKVAKAHKSDLCSLQAMSPFALICCALCREAIAAGKSQDELSRIVSALPGNFMHLISEASSHWHDDKPDVALLKAEAAISALAI